MRAISPIPPVPLIYKEDWEIDARLVPFLVTRPELIEVARAVVGARADAVDNDPLSAEGQFAYIFGTRSTRSLWRRKGWLLHRAENIESVKHPKLDWLVTYQSVDLAASLIHEPRAVSGKGAGADRFIDAAQGISSQPKSSGPRTSSQRIWAHGSSVYPWMVTTFVLNFHVRLGWAAAISTALSNESSSSAVANGRRFLFCQFQRMGQPTSSQSSLVKRK